MPIIADPTINRDDWVTIEQYRRFLAARGVDADTWWVGPLADRPDATARLSVAVGYTSPAGSRRERSAETAVWIGGRSVVFASRYRVGLAYLFLVFMDGADQRARASLDPDQPVGEALSRFGLHRDLIRADVSAYAPGTYLAPHDGGWRYYLVEGSGQVVPIADCATPAPLAWQIWSERKRSDTGQAGALAAFIPVNSAEFLRGDTDTLSADVRGDRRP